MDLIEFYQNCNPIHPKDLIGIIKSRTKSNDLQIHSIINELKPSDLYCYLYAKFGMPNGIQNFLRGNTSDNLIHWEWTLEFKDRFIHILGKNLKTEIWLIGGWDSTHKLPDQLVEIIKNDYSNYKKEMGEIRKSLEDWDIFTNTYQSLKKSINQLKKDLDSLDLDPLNEKPKAPKDLMFTEETQENWAKILTKYHRGIGLSMSLNIMIPILAESFVNLIFFILCRRDIKDNKRIFDSFTRSNIDVKIQSLHIHCIGFKKAIDWSSDACKEYNNIINRRNDLLHGNINIKTLKHSEIFFNQRVPIFKEYRSIWQHSIGTALNYSRFSELSHDLKAVDLFIEYVLSCLEDSIKDGIAQFMESPDIGHNKKDSRLGVLLPHHLVDSYIPTEDLANE